MNTSFFRFAILFLIFLAGAAAGAELTLAERYLDLKNGVATTLPDSPISLVSIERNGLLGAEATSILPHPYTAAAAGLTKVENWCEFLPLHFNIKACIYETDAHGERLTLYSGRKTYQTPESGHKLAYRVVKRDVGEGQFTLLLQADSGPAGTRDYRIEVAALQVKEGTLLHISTAYRPSLTSALLTRSYLSTLGRDKVGFTHIEQEGDRHPVQGMRGVIERNVMRYQLAIDTFLTTEALPAPLRREAALKGWFRENERYPRQLHEMSEAEYLAIKRKEWDNQQQLQQAVNKKHQLAELRQ